MKKYLDPAALHHLSGMQIRARLVVEGFFAGMHKSPLKGHSTDFADYRRYTKGDDLKHIDWKVYAKADRYYIKEFEEQTSLTAWILLDASSSMNYGRTELRKIDYASYLAAALMYLMMRQDDNVGLATFRDRIGDVIGPRRGPGHLDRLLTHLEELEPEGLSNVAACLEGLGERLKKRGLVVVLSDLMDDPQGILDALQRLRAMRNEVLVFHVLDPDELEFPFDQMMEFEDLESGGRLKIDCKAVRRSYRERLAAYLEAFSDGCPRSGVDYVLADTSKTFHEVLSTYIARRNQVRR